VNCPFCDSETEYSNIGNHWRQSCGYPEPNHLTDDFDGLLMGDGCLKQTHNPDKRAGNQSIEVVSINKKFVDFLYDEYYPYFNKPKVRRTAEESANSAINSEYLSGDTGNTFRTQYRIVSKAIPFFNRYDSWKSTGDKRWPKDIEFNPTQIRYLYVADGGLSWNKKTKSSRAQITSSNEPDMIDRLVDKFNNIGIYCRSYEDRMIFKARYTQEFLNFIGAEPVPGFEYKWEIDSLDRYESLYRNVYYDEAETYTI